MGIRGVLRNRGKQIDAMVNNAVAGESVPKVAAPKKGLNRSAGGYTSANAPWLRKKPVKPAVRRDMMGRVIK